jgi:hypothetical protein
LDGRGEEKGIIIKNVFYDSLPSSFTHIHVLAKAGLIA